MRHLFSEWSQDMLLHCDRQTAHLLHHISVAMVLSRTLGSHNLAYGVGVQERDSSSCDSHSQEPPKVFHRKEPDST